MKEVGKITYSFSHLKIFNNPLFCSIESANNLSATDIKMEGKARISSSSFSFFPPLSNIPPGSLMVCKVFQRHEI